MSITNELFKNSYDVKGSLAITTGMTTYTYEGLLESIDGYTGILDVYKSKGIDRVAVITKNQINFNTLSLIFALLKTNITPIIINECFKDQIPGILEKDDDQIVFYDSINKPSYLKRKDLLIDKFRRYFVSVRPYIQVRNLLKMCNLNWYLSFLKSEKEQLNCVCKLYDKVDGKIEETIVTENDIFEYAKNMCDLEYNGKWMIAITTLPLYKKEGFLYLTRALSNDMHVICLNDVSTRKTISKILKNKPSCITIDDYMLAYIIENLADGNIDLSFLKKVSIDVSEEQINLVHIVLQKCNFNGNYFEMPEPITHAKKLTL